jgi:hypothetical protein
MSAMNVRKAKARSSDSTCILILLMISALSARPTLATDSGPSAVSQPSPSSGASLTRNWTPSVANPLPQNYLDPLIATCPNFLTTGKLSTVADAKTLIAVLRKALPATPSPTVFPDVDTPAGAYIIHVVKWDDDGSSFTFSNWYLYDPAFPSGFGYWGGDASIIQRQAIAGESSVTLLYVYLVSGNPTKDTLASSLPTYSLSVTQSTPSWLSEIALAASVATGGKVPIKIDNAAYTALAHGPFAAPKPPVVAYFAYKTFTVDDRFRVSSWKLQTQFGGLDSNLKVKAAADGSDAVTYQNEAASAIGFSGAMPLTPYTDVVRQGSAASNFSTKNVSRQSPYLCADIYLPFTVEPSLQNSFWLPHVVVGLPLTGKVLEHPLLGIASSLRFVEIFAAVSPDWENVSPTFKHHFVSHGMIGAQVTLAQLQSLVGKSN